MKLKIMSWNQYNIKVVVDNVIFSASGNFGAISAFP